MCRYCISEPDSARADDPIEPDPEFDLVEPNPDLLDESEVAA